MKVVRTNWINIVSVFVITYFYVIADVFIHSGTFVQAILGGLISICLYGMMFWGLFAASLITFDLLLKINNHNQLKEKLFVEWLLISSPFIFWAFKYNEWIFIVGCLAFFISQTLRKSLITAIQR